MLAGRTRTGKSIYRAWQVCGNNHELITGSRGFTVQDHRDAIELFRQLAKNELGENGPTEFYHQYRRLQEMHLMHISPTLRKKLPAVSSNKAHL